MEKRESEGYVKDLVEKLQKGEVTPKEALKGLEERGLTEKESWEIIPWVAYFILWLPLNFKFSAQLQAISFPAIIMYLPLVLVAVGIFFLIWAGTTHRTRGGLKKMGEAIILYKEGPYRIIRHPQAFGMMWPILLPIILSAYVPFTILSIAAIIVMIVYFYIGIHVEEKLDVEKWGDEYAQYMKEVPRFNFIKGLWNLRKKK